MKKYHHAKLCIIKTFGLSSEIFAEKSSDSWYFFGMMMCAWFITLN